MTLLGGIVFRNQHQQVERELLQAMAKATSETSDLIGIGSGPAGVFTTGGSSHIESNAHVLVTGDLDLTNLEELYSHAGLPVATGGLLGALYSLEGWKFVSRLRGGFAFALWDRQKCHLLLAVDRFGMKRLHYLLDGSKMAFASRPSALLGLPGADRRLDPTAAFHYLNFGFIPAPSSIFAGILRLPPGHLLSFHDGQVKLEEYWDLTYPEHSIGETEGAARLYQLTEEAVRRALSGISPKEVGAFLSGGTDSSTVVGLMGRATGRPVKAFSIGFKEERYNELGYASLAARHFGASHYHKIVTADEAFNAIAQLIEVYDEPFGNNSVIPTYLCAKLARECGIRYLLAGDGGDEIFGGNERYRTDQIFARYSRIPSLLRRRVIEPVFAILPDGGASVLGKAQRYVRRANFPNPQRFYSYQFFAAQEYTKLFTPEFVGRVALEAPWKLVQDYYNRAHAVSELNRLLYLDIKLTIGDNDLLKVMRTAELADVGVRFPMLDQRLVEFTGTLPVSFKVKGLEQRYLFKRAFANLLPTEILAKPKQGFGLPVSLWLKSHQGWRELAHDTLHSARALERGYFQNGAIEELFRLHEADTTPFYGDLLWSVLMFELWHRRHLDGMGPA